jgi:hypothetical protein
MLRRIGRWILYLFLLFGFAIFTGGFFFLAVPMLLAFGWIPYLVRTLPEVSIAVPDLAFGAACLAMLVFGGHRFLQWLYRAWRRADDESDDADRWLPRWTGSLVALLVLLFSANIATVGVVHQLGWITKAPIVTHSWASPFYRARRICTHIKYTKNSANELRVAIWQDPELRRNARGLHVLVREQSDGDVIAAIFPRGPAVFQYSGLRVCSAELDEQHDAANAPDALREYGFDTAASLVQL